MESVQIDSLVSCKKSIKTPPKKLMTADARNIYTLRNDFTCVSDDGKSFEVFMRMNTELPFLFSIGLKYRSEEGVFTICRYNGKHEHRNKIMDKDRFNDFHIHKLYDAQLSDGTDSSMDANITERYVTFQEALYAFLTDCNITGWEKYFPDLEDSINQIRMDGV